MRFVPGYREEAALTNGARVLLRLVEAGDAPLMLAAFEKLSNESRYHRFFAHKSSLSEEEVRLFTGQAGPTHFAIAALSDGAGVGVARFIRLVDESGTAEAAVTVIDAFQRLGLGRLLAERLLLAASEWGLQRLDFVVLADNTAMAALLHALAPAAAIERVSGLAWRYRVPVA